MNRKEYKEKAINAKSGRQFMFYTLQMLGFAERDIKGLLKHNYEFICETILKGMSNKSTKKVLVENVATKVEGAAK